MSQSLAKVLLHVVFSTKNRTPFLREPVLRAEMHRYLGGILAKSDCAPIIVGGVEDHVHLLFTFSRMETIAGIIKEVKRSSSVWIKQRSTDHGAFAWQTGYGAFSIGFSQKDAVAAYIARQEEHHRTLSFQEEFRALLQRYEIAFDERYVWD
jgi:putative transposase